jgi:type IV pilus assembly protein PilW
MTTSNPKIRFQRGTTLVELMVAMAITMFIVAAAGYVYLGTRESQSAIDRSATSAETGSFAIHFVGRDIMNAGFYPSTMPAIATYTPSMGRAGTYPPGQGIPALATDWTAPDAVYLAPIFGCDGAKFDPKTATCGATVAGTPDSIVLNYFTSESTALGANVGQRIDCTGAKIENDPSNAVRKLNEGSPAALTQNDNLPPQQPLFGSNFYSLNPTAMVVDNQTVNTQSLACGGNGNSPFGSTITTTYVPLVAGIEDLQFTYGVFNTETTRTPDRFYTATEVGALTAVSIDGILLGPWSRVVAVRVCMLSRTLGGNTKIADKTGALRTYVNCSNQTITQAAGDTTLYKRHDQVFALRNRLNQSY